MKQVIVVRKGDTETKIDPSYQEKIELDDPDYVLANTIKDLVNAINKLETSTRR